MRRLIAYIFILFVLASCGSKKDTNEYLYSIDKELSPLKGNPDKVRVLYNRELLKYKKTGEEKYHYSAMFIEPAMYAEKRLTQIPLIYNLLNLNNGRYDFLTIICNFNLASQFESSSPDWSFRCINEAIETAEQSEEEYYLPHLYHFKGRLLFNKGMYKEAMTFFTKALQLYEIQNKMLYVASMHNNYGMCYEKTNQIDLAINEVKKGIEILNKESASDKQNLVFINYLKGILAQYQVKKGNYPYAENLLLEIREFSFDNSNYRMALNTSKSLIDIYHTTNQAQKIPRIADSLKVIEPHLILPKNKIILNELAQEYYAENNDYKNFGIVSKKLVQLNKEQNDFNKKELKINFDIADNYVIKNVQQQHQSEKRKNQLLLLSGGLAFIILVFALVYLIREKMKKEKIIEQAKIISENQKKILEQNIELQQEKIRNLHLNLNLKTETEKTFLENLKKLKRSKVPGSEEIVKDLQFKINNLILIDKKNNELINESSRENQLFMENLSSAFPQLTQQELKLCVYFRLHLSAKEISLLEKYTVGSIRVYKTKIKSKMALEKDDDLDTFLNTFNNS